MHYHEILLLECRWTKDRGRSKDGMSFVNDDKEDVETDSDEDKL